MTVDDEARRSAGKRAYCFLLSCSAPPTATDPATSWVQRGYECFRRAAIGGVRGGAEPALTVTCVLWLGEAVRKRHRDSRGCPLLNIAHFFGMSPASYPAGEGEVDQGQRSQHLAARLREWPAGATVPMCGARASHPVIFGVVPGLLCGNTREKFCIFLLKSPEIMLK